MPDRVPGRLLELQRLVLEERLQERRRVRAAAASEVLLRRPEVKLIEKGSSRIGLMEGVYGNPPDRSFDSFLLLQKQKGGNFSRGNIYRMFEIL